MNNIRVFTGKIRDYVNISNLYDKYYKDNPDKWNMLCVSMDTLEELRNLTVGHPIEMERGKIVKRCFITRVSISSQGFLLVVYNATENKDEFEDIDLQKLYSGYKMETTNVLNKILNNVVR